MTFDKSDSQMLIDHLQDALVFEGGMDKWEEADHELDRLWKKLAEEGPVVVPFLVDCLTYPVAHVRDGALMVLRKFQWEPSTYAETLAYKLALDEFLPEIQNISDVFELLMSWLQSKDFPTRNSAICYLATEGIRSRLDPLKFNRVVAPIIAKVATDDREYIVRDTAVFFLVNSIIPFVNADILVTSILPALHVAAISNETFLPEHKIRALEGLGEIGERVDSDTRIKIVIPAVAAALFANDDHRVCEVAAKILVGFGDSATLELLKALESEEYFIYQSVIDALKRANRETVVTLQDKAKELGLRPDEAIALGPSQLADFIRYIAHKKRLGY